jgi:hypothetical protein
MVQSGLRRTGGVWVYFIVGVKGLIVDWRLAYAFDDAGW